MQIYFFNFKKFIKKVIPTIYFFKSREKILLDEQILIKNNLTRMAKKKAAKKVAKKKPAKKGKK